MCKKYKSFLFDEKYKYIERGQFINIVLEFVPPVI